MSKDPTKDFDAIADDYVFFETHSTESQEDVLAYGRRLANWQPRGERLRMLDFGCGSGTFTTKFLDHVGWPSDRLELTLVDPAEDARCLAVERLAKFTSRPIASAASLPAGSTGKFDFILANHVFYYVPELESRLGEWTAAIAPGGMMLAAIASRENVLLEFWTIGFGEVGREIPYYTAEDVSAALQRLEIPFERQVVPYRIEFADSRENRLKMIRFLLADHLAEMLLEPLLALFDKHSRAGRIEIETASEHFTVPGGSAVPDGQ